MEKRVGKRAFLRKEKRLEKEKKRNVQKANKMLIPVRKKTMQSLGMLALDPEGIFYFREHRWIKVFEATGDTLCQIANRIPNLLGRARITMHSGGKDGRETCHLTLMENGDNYEEIQKQFQMDEAVLRELVSLKPLSVNEVMNQIAENFYKEISFSYASSVRGNKDFKRECFAEGRETKDSFSYGEKYGECFLVLSFPTEGKENFVESLTKIGCEFYLGLDLNSLSEEEQQDFHRTLEKRYNRRLSGLSMKEYLNVSLTVVILCDSEDARKIVEQTMLRRMEREGILLAPAYDAQIAYLESVVSLGICDAKTIRNVDKTVISGMFGGEAHANATIKV